MPTLEPALRERETAQAFQLLRRNPLACDQNMEILAHAGGSYQMFELQGDFGVSPEEDGSLQRHRQIDSALRFP